MLRKSVIITGAFGGIGRATAEKFAKNGYNLALTYLNTFDPEFLSHLKSFGVDVIALRVDQKNESDIINFVNSVVKEFEYISSAVFCAGKAEPECLLAEKSTELIDDIISSNLRGTILFNREVLKHMMKQKNGTIVNVSSIYGQTGGSLESVYSACKAGIINLTKTLATEVSPFVRVNCVAPGYIETKMTEHLPAETKKYIEHETPLERLGRPEDVANSIFFFATDESSFITGETLLISGGVVKL